MRMTINVKTGRIYLPKEAVDFLGTDRVEITSEDNQFTINRRTGDIDDGIKISKDNAIYDGRVAKWIAGQYDMRPTGRVVAAAYTSKQACRVRIAMTETVKTYYDYEI